MMETEKSGPLDGVRVLDLSRVLAGPWAAQILGDMGATVLKVEHPRQGDDTRRWGPPFIPDDSGDAAYFSCANRNKEALAIDFSTPEGADLVRRLAARSDVLVENFKPGSLARYGLDFQTLSAINPRLIYCSITGFGQSGPYKDRGGYDFLVQGMSGLMSITGHPDGEPGGNPTKVGIPVADLFTGVYAATSIVAAIVYQQRTGRGQHIDAALLDTQLAVMANQAASYLVGGTLATRLGNGHPTVVPYRDFHCADGIILVAIGNDRQFVKLCNLLGKPDIADDPRFAINAGRLGNRHELEALLAAEILPWKSEHLLAEMDRHGLPAGPINTLNDTFADPHVIERDVVKTVTRTGGADLKVVGYPHRFSETPTNVRRAPPRLGEHTRDVLVRELDLSQPELDTLVHRGIIAAAKRAADASFHPGFKDASRLEPTGHRDISTP